MGTRSRRRGAILKTPDEIAIMRDANQYLAEILYLMCEAARPGVSTWELDELARRELKKKNLESPFLGYGGYPATVCTSVNEVVVHGIPSKEVVLEDGDIIGIDFGVTYRGFIGDSARTVAVGSVSSEAQALVNLTEKSLDAAIAVCWPGTRISEIGRVVEEMAEQAGYGVVRDFVGHGIGRRMHEEPQVPNYYHGPKARMPEGLVIAIEPMLNACGPEVEVLEDGWTAVTSDGGLSAHFEHSVAVTADGPLILSSQRGIS